MYDYTVFYVFVIYYFILRDWNIIFLWFQLQYVLLFTRNNGIPFHALALTYVYVIAFLNAIHVFPVVGNTRPYYTT